VTPQGAAALNNGDLMDWIALWQRFAEQSMARLMVKPYFDALPQA
jgi:hypothetical protein